MARPKRCRKICGFPEYWSFVPEETESSETTFLMLDEYEVIRLIDFEKMTQEECAGAMGVSRATIAGIYERARYKIADTIVNGKRIRITGGAYKIDSIPAAADLPEKKCTCTRVAIPYDGETVGQHFGRSEQFRIYDVEDRKIIFAKTIGTNGARHAAIAGFLHVSEVDTLICGGIGMGARNALQEVGIHFFPGVSGSVDDAIKSYLDGKLVNNSLI